MIKAKLTNGDIILGLSAANVEKLMERHPIKFDGRPMGFAGAVIIMYGETEIAMLHELQEAQHMGEETKQ